MIMRGNRAIGRCGTAGRKARGYSGHVSEAREGYAVAVAALGRKLTQGEKVVIDNARHHEPHADVAVIIGDRSRLQAAHDRIQVKTLAGYGFKARLGQPFGII